MHCGLCDSVAISFLKISTSDLWSTMIWTSMAKYIDEMYLVHGVFPMLLSPYCHNICQHLIGFGLQMYQVLRCCCEVLHLEGSSFHPWSAEVQLPTPTQVYLFLGTEVLFYNRNLCRHFNVWGPLLCQIIFGSSHSTTILFSLIWASSMAYMLLLYFEENLLK